MGRVFERVMDHLDILAKGVANKDLIIKREPPNVNITNNYYVLQLKKENKLLKEEVRQLKQKNRVIEIEAEQE